VVERLLDKIVLAKHVPAPRLDAARPTRMWLVRSVARIEDAASCYARKRGSLDTRIGVAD
jgi:hypothetical protein